VRSLIEVSEVGVPEGDVFPFASVHGVAPSIKREPQEQSCSADLGLRLGLRSGAVNPPILSVRPPLCFPRSCAGGGAWIFTRSGDGRFLAVPASFDGHDRRSSMFQALVRH